MTKFLGVISNSAKSCSIQRVFEFSDLELLSDCLFGETQNLYYDFLQKLSLINDRELIILENSKNLAQTYDYLLELSSNMLVMEGEINEVGNCLSHLDAVICHMEHKPQNFPNKCKSNSNRDRIHSMLVKLSVDVHKMECQIEESKEQECALSVENLRSWTLRLMPFLELHTKILLHLEEKINTINDLLKHVDGMFSRLSKQHMCAHLNKEVSDC